MANRDLLQGLADNPALCQAVFELIEEQFALDQISTTISNEYIGQIVRANIDGRAKVAAAFKIIAQYKSPPSERPKVNKAI